jgi:putative inorganic carbon (hco3(-)) transporter
MKGLIFTYLMTYGGSAVALFRPYTGLLIYVCFGILKPEIVWAYAVPVGNYSRTIAICLLLGWAFQGFGDWKLGRSRPIIAVLLGFWLWSALSALVAPDQAVAWGFVEATSKIILPFLVGLTTVDSPRKLGQLAWVIVLSLAYIAFLENEKYFSGFMIERDNIIAHQMVLGIAPSLILGMQAEARWKKALGYVSAALMIHTVLIHFSRGAMLGMIVVAAATLMVIPRKPIYYVAVLAAVLLALRLAGPEVRDRFMTIFASSEERDGSAQSRLDLWRDMSDAIGRHPVFGLGPDHWPLTAASYGWPPGKEGHGLWVQTTAELGLPGGAFFLLIYLLSVVALFRWIWGRFGPVDPTLSVFARMVAPALAGFLFEAQFGSFEGIEVPYYLVLLGAGALKVASKEWSDGVQSWTPAPFVVRAQSPRSVDTMSEV